MYLGTTKPVLHGDLDYAPHGVEASTRMCDTLCVVLLKSFSCQYHTPALNCDKKTTRRNVASKPGSLVPASHTRHQWKLAGPTQHQVGWKCAGSVRYFLVTQPI